MKNAFFENRKTPFTVFLGDHLTPLPHFHKDIEIIYVVEGSCMAYADNNKCIVRSGQLFIAFPNQIHYYENTKPGKYLAVIVSPDVIFNSSDLLYDFVPKENLVEQISSEQAELLTKLTAYHGEYKSMLQAGILNQFLATLLPGIPLRHRIKSDNATLREILKYCSENAASPLTLEDVSKELHISTFHISRLINNKLGLSFNGYLNSIRVYKACALLEDSGKKIIDISQDVGFGSVRSFNRAFKEIMNVSPLQYRRMND